MKFQTGKLSICNFRRQNLCTHITALKVLENFLFVVESNQVLLFDWREKSFLEKEIVFQSNSIHGIRIDDSQTKILFFGGKSIRIYAINFSSLKRLVSITEEFNLNDWIHDIQWITEEQNVKNTFAAISAHNCFTIWNIDNGKVDAFQSSENCIVYSGNIICKACNALVVAVGTVFKEIILWSPNSSLESNGRKLPLQNLIGHQGVIFSISYNTSHKLLSSTSDDRSVRLWKVSSDPMLNDDSLEFWQKANIENIHVLFAHESRVWMSTIVENCILSVGEDSHLCFWDLNGKLLKKKKCHKGGSIWCLETCMTPKNEDDDKKKEMKKYFAFTGGSDGGVYMWDVGTAFACSLISQISLYFREGSSRLDFPRIISLLTDQMSGHLMVTTDKGWLSLYNIELQNWNDILYNNDFASYCVPSISSGSAFLALGNIYGELALLSITDFQSEKRKIKKLRIHEGKVCSVHWVNKTNDYLLTCGIKGQMVFWKVHYDNMEFDIESIQELFLPKCKHHWWSTAALYISNEDCIIVGDRSGSISVYSKLHANINSQKENNKINPSMIHRYIHGDNGVTDIQQHKSLIYSAGRDGKVQLYAMCDNNLNLLHTIKVSHDLEWIGRMLFYNEDLLLLGFHTKDFMVWSTQLESSIMTVECGGGHRSWDFSLTEDGVATFAAIKRKDVIFSKENLQHVLNKSIMKTGISGQEFCHACYMFTKNYSSEDSMSVVAFGGEDNALRIIGLISKMGQEHNILSLCSLSGHLSSIRAINKFKMVEENSYLVVSVGGRSQMMIWKITDNTFVQGQQLASYILSDLGKTTKHHSKEYKNIQVDPQTRLMDVSICISGKLESEVFMICTVCSDSYFRIYTFDINTRELLLCYNLYHGEHCILKLSQIQITNYSNQNVVFTTGATDGYIRFVNYESPIDINSSLVQNNILPQPVLLDMRLKNHQSGINALDIKFISGTNWLIGSAGDDNTLTICVVTFSSGDVKCDEISSVHVKNAHSSQITGIKIMDKKTIVSASIDQRINIWTWTFREGQLFIDLVLSKMSLIPDIAYLDAWQNEITKEWTLLVCGQGFESFTFAIKDETDL
ncbi:WD repeat-containing protein 6 [Nephila pilipes]|uniref:tRNA (34-2'-O)-methyltransferase regulator WDR6 n=1 Tax=Nephila pilipes TaxID=299642 RepID=A0A8X6T4I7_NEPPI|nr:WD repeat-containing protein 6 [Nephila pilipes]